MLILGRFLAILILPLMLFLAILVALSVWARGGGSFKGILGDILDDLRKPPKGL